MEEREALVEFLFPSLALDVEMRFAKSISLLEPRILIAFRTEKRLCRLTGQFHV